MKNKAIVMEHLMSYTPQESVYKKLYELRDSPKERQDYLASITEYAKEQNLFIPEIVDLSESLSENKIPSWLHITKSNHVFLLKYFRYTPVFFHEQDYFEIFYVLSGTCHHLLENTERKLQKGDFCFVPPFKMHSLSVFDDSIVISIFIRRDTFDDIFFNTIRSYSILSRFFMSGLYSKEPAKRLVFSTQNDTEIEDLILDMYLETISGDEYSSRLLCNMAPILFTKILRKYNKTAVIDADTEKSSSNQIALQILSYINDHFRDISLEETAIHFNYSVPHCSKLIRQETGTSFRTILRKIRINRAVSLLENTTSSIAEIGYSVGYENTESFIRAFEKVHGQSPSAFRKKSAIS
ncbi:MAG: helix-turn-helix domain-containing protein [Lachnospiraceae bacterium]|nr:helix-turn-helix domain-containing protein [Lachnospiraceae bacterium]